MQRRSFTITKLERSPEGFWTARISANGEAVKVDKRFGSWEGILHDGDEEVRKPVLFEAAVALQEKVRPLEKAEKAAMASG